MSTISLSAAHGQRRPHSLVMTLVVRVLRAFERRRALQELAALDDRMLSDIGVRRADIGLVVDSHRY
ncbi:MAG TPA: DUF1127 domain-containing protein [Stellaceae bacterium]|nr:DUF1127 domain-containing protein [Stellaceae bacterium]